MIDEDLDPQKRKPKPKDLDIMSVEALEAYIAELETEIGRARAAIEAKQNHRSAAESFFRK